jgi:anaerobic ribonucleoside-triphosphate reductase activating protein
VASTIVNLALVIPRTEAEGPGVRFAVWVQGCPLRCAGCCNPEMLAFNPKRPRDAVPAEALARQALETEGVEGVTFLGGEPFAQAPALAEVARAVRAGGLSVMVFSGYTIAELRAQADAAELLAHTDLLVDGRYDEARRTTARRWIGSDNQVMHFLTDRYQPDDPRFHAPNHLEIRMRDGVITLNGFPVAGARTRL